MMSFIGRCDQLNGELVNAVRWHPCRESITLAEFRKVVDTTDFEREAGYDADFPLDGDWHVEYCRSVMPDGREAFYLVWSAFEYIWVKARFFDIGEDE